MAWLNLCCEHGQYILKRGENWQPIEAYCNFLEEYSRMPLRFLQLNTLKSFIFFVLSRSNLCTWKTPGFLMMRYFLSKNSLAVLIISKFKLLFFVYASFNTLNLHRAMKLEKILQFRMAWSFSNDGYKLSNMVAIGNYDVGCFPA